MVKYIWRQSFLGGGGYITGILQNPSDPEILYARCDVAGIFKSIDGGKSWQPKNNGMSLCHHHSVQSFAISPHNPNVLFRCSGEARGNRVFGTLHKSRDGGESWYEVCDQADFYGNGPTRMCGEVIEVHPRRSGFVIAGSYTNGIWVSEDEGESWECSGLKGERISCVVFHPLDPETIYAATIGDTGLVARKDYSLELMHDIPRSEKGKLFCSDDLGKSWRLLSEGMNFSQLAFDGEEENTLYAACVQDGLQKSTDRGATWNKIGHRLPDRFDYRVVAADPFHSAVLYTIPNLVGVHEDIDPIALYRSEDRGETWNLVKRHGPEDISKYPDYMTLWHAGWAPSKLRVDLRNPEKLYLSNWYGVSISEDGGRTWCGNYFKGTETICGESILCDPQVEGKVYIAMADHAPAVSTDHGRSYTQLPSIPNYGNSTAIAASRHNGSVLVYGVRNRHGDRDCCIAVSKDGGRTARAAIAFGEGLFVQALAEDFHIPGTFYAYVDGFIRKGAGIYKSHDWGESWTQVNTPFPDYLLSLPHRKQWIEAELLPVVVYQVKNVCGANQLLCSDPHQRDTMYIGEWTEGIFMTTDGCGSWQNIGTTLPFNRSKASVLNVIKTDETRPGVLYAGFIREGLWRSEDYGKSWSKIYPADDTVFNATSLAVGGPTNREIHIACEPLYWSPCSSAVIFSPDYGANWFDISDKSLGALRWKGIAVEKSTGILHGITCGNGVFYAEPEVKDNQL